MLKAITITIKVIFFLLASYALVHVFAILGIFVAFAYPLWWIVSPKTVVCISCRSKRFGGYCHICKSQVDGPGLAYPKSFFSVIVNALIIIAITVLSIFLVFFEYRLMVNSGYIEVTPKNVTFKIPDKGQYKTGEIFPVKIEVDGVDRPINVVQADLGFDSDKIEVVEVSIKDSFAKVFIQKEINNEVGYVRLTGGLQNPGYSEKGGLLGTVYFKSKQAGLVDISFLPTTMVLANDGRGTNMVKELPVFNYIILPERITFEQEQIQNAYFEDEVLGVTEEEDKLIFFGGEGNSSVLGATTEEDEGTGNNVLVAVIRTVDSFILRFLDFLFSIFGFDLNLHSSKYQTGG